MDNLLFAMWLLDKNHRGCHGYPASCYACPVYAGITVQFAVESVSSLVWNTQSERKEMIDRTHELPLIRQCEIPELARSTAYYQPQPESPEDLALMRRIDELHMEMPYACWCRRDFDPVRQNSLTHPHHRCPA